MKYFILSIDATTPDGRLGRLVNDSSKPNCVMKKATYNYLPNLNLSALQDLEVGTELRYDYGVVDLPWRQRVCTLLLYHKMNVNKMKTEDIVNR